MPSVREFGILMPQDYYPYYHQAAERLLNNHYDNCADPEKAHQADIDLLMFKGETWAALYKNDPGPDELY